MRLDHLLSKDIFGTLLLEKRLINVCCSVLKVYKNFLNTDIRKTLRLSLCFRRKAARRDSKKWAQEENEVSSFVL